MNKVLIIQEIIPHYRIPLFNEIGNDTDIDLTIAYDGINKLPTLPDHSFEILPYSNRKIWRFYDIKNIRDIVKQYDQIIVLFDLRWLPTFIKLLLNRKKPKIYFWGMGISNGNTKKPVLDRIRFFLSDISSGTIIYSSKIAEYYLRNVKKKNQVHVASNTVFIRQFPFPSSRRTRILFLGTFKAYKNLSDLIVAFNKIINEIPAYITLDFVGDGEEEEKKLRAQVDQLGLKNRVVFWGRKESDEEVYPIVSEAIVSVCPGQAGLGVLHSMAFGCPFLTSHDAITGGERFYIENNVNSYFYDPAKEDLADKILWIINNPEFNGQIAKNAYEFYHTKCSIKNYAGSFIRIIKNEEHANN